ncbi:MAG: 30S ribosomal protein S17 [Phycisphaerales bacterium]
MSAATKPKATGGSKATTGGTPASSHVAMRRTRTGVVESDARIKTRTVVVDRQARHAKYGKIMRRQTVLQVHDEHNASKRGDTVEIGECRPISKSKRWTLVRVVKRAAAV